MFNGKVSIYHKENGKIKKIEKDFDNMKEYHNFLNENDMWSEEPKMSIWDWSQLHDYMNNMLNEKLGLSDDFYYDDEDLNEDDEGESMVDLNHYESQLHQLRQEQQDDRDIIQMAKMLERHNKDLKQLEVYKSEFTAMGKKAKDPFMKRLEKDIKTVQKEIKNLEKQLKN